MTASGAGRAAGTCGTSGPGLVTAPPPPPDFYWVALFRGPCRFGGVNQVFTFAHTASATSKLAKGSASAGEPWVSYFTPEEVGAMLR